MNDSAGAIISIFAAVAVVIVLALMLDMILDGKLSSLKLKDKKMNPVNLVKHFMWRRGWIELVWFSYRWNATTSLREWHLKIVHTNLETGVKGIKDGGNFHTYSPIEDRPSGMKYDTNSIEQRRYAGLSSSPAKKQKPRTTMFRTKHAKAAQVMRTFDVEDQNKKEIEQGMMAQNASPPLRVHPSSSGWYNMPINEDEDVNQLVIDSAKYWASEIAKGAKDAE